MEREHKLRLNTIVALVNQVIYILSGFILPRFYLQTYGSQVYGLVSSIGQFLGFVTLMELGMGAVVQSALYAPLAKKDKDQVSRIVISAERFFRKIAVCFLIYTILLMIIYPLFIQDTFGWWFEASLIAIISISSLAEYFFGITYKLLLTADQKAYIILGLQSIGIILNFIICIVLMRMGFSIQIVKLVSAIVLLIRPLAQSIYVKKIYHLDKTLTLTEEPIKQKWNGIAQHVAYYVTNNTDTIVLSVLSTLENVSIYAIYNMVANGIKQLILTLNTGTQALFGNMLANGEIKELSARFKQFEWSMHTIVTLLFTNVGILIVPFVTVYTNGINDADYMQPLFAVILTLATASYCIRLPYNTMVCAAGHYKETQTSAIVEMCLNLGISIILVYRFGLIGVAVGTFVALAYRTIYLAWYLSKNIIYHKIKYFIKNLLVDALSVILITLITREFSLNNISYLSWFVLAIQVFSVSVIVILIVNLLFYRQNIRNILHK